MILKKNYFKIAKMKKRNKKKKRGGWKAVTMLVLALLLFVVGFATLWISTLKLPSLDNFEMRDVAQSTKIYARDGKTLLFNVHRDIRRTHVPLDQISRHIKNATIAIEDTEFYSHHGIKPKALLRAFFVDLFSGGYKQGGSTITQQVIKNALLTREKSIVRKVKELILAIKLERKMSKDQILEIYLNEAPYGGNILGVEEASQRFFNKHASEVSLAEAAYLAALPKAPSYYSPFGTHKDALEARKNTVLDRMYKTHFISRNEYLSALNEKVSFQKVDDGSIRAPHFVFYVINQLIKSYGKEAVYTGGLRVVTTLDPELQDKTQEIIKKYALLNEKKFNAENAAAVILDSQTGQILTMVGSRDYFDKKIDGKFNVTVSKRQPGSTFKPLVYVRSFEKGLTPSTVVFDVPTQFSTSCRVNDFSMKHGCYAPQNYDFKFRGPMTLRNALAQSINIPAVKVLHIVGIDDALQFAKKLGIKSLKSSARHYGLPLVLGGGEVTPLEMAGVFATFANDGAYNKPSSILSITDAADNKIYQWEANPVQVIKKQAVRQLNSILTDFVAREPAYGRNSFYFKGQLVAVKTGTTNDYKDVWIDGFTPKVTLVTWAGNNDNSPIVKKVAGFVLAPMWKKIMLEAIKKYPGGKFIPPEPTQSQKGILNGIWYYPDLTPPVHSILYWVDKNNPAGPPPSNPAKDILYAYFEYAVQTWFGTHGSELNIPAANTEPEVPEQQTNSQTTQNTSHNGTSNNPSFYIKTPAQGSSLPAGHPTTISVRYQNINVKSVKYYLNESFLGSVSNPPFSITVVPQKRPGAQIIKAIALGAHNEEYFAQSSFVAQ